MGEFLNPDYSWPLGSRANLRYGGFFSLCEGVLLRCRRIAPFPPAGRLAGEAALLGGEPGVMWTAEGRKRTLARLA